MSRQNNAALTRRPAGVVPVLEAWTPFNEMHRQMDDVFGRVFGVTPLSRVLATPTGTGYRAFSEISPDIWETNEELVFVLPVPGVEPGELNIEATADTLSIRGERKPFYQNENARHHHQSWWSASQGAFEASYTLPFEIDPQRIQANYRNGVLELHLPKAEAVKPKAIKVNVVGDTTVEAK